MRATSTVIYPAIGFCGSTNCVRVHGKTLAEVKALGRTSRERFDLAVEVVARFYNGVASPQVEQRDIPREFLAPWATVATL